MLVLEYFVILHFERSLIYDKHTFHLPRQDLPDVKKRL